jgi:putative redox protein
MEIVFEGGKVVTALLNGHKIKTDQPLDNYGENSAPAPFDLYMASIGTCAGIYVKSFCDRRNIPTDKIKLLQNIEYNNETHLPVKVNIEIKLPPDFPDKYRDAVVSTAELCAVKRSIANPPLFTIFTSETDG